MACEALDKKMDRLRVEYFLEDDSRACLEQVRTYTTDNHEVREKVQQWLAGRVVAEGRFSQKSECNVGGCDRVISESPNNGRKVTGSCLAATYCLSKTFAAVASAPTVDEGRALYREIIDSLDGFVSSGSAGNFCPRGVCDLSAGVSVDMVPGTDGKCAEPTSTQLEIEIGAAV